MKTTRYGLVMAAVAMVMEDVAVGEQPRLRRAAAKPVKRAAVKAARKANQRRQRLRK